MSETRNKRLIISVAAFLIFAAAGALYVFSPAEPRRDVAQMWGYKPTPVYGGVTVKQEFVPQSDDLSAIGIQFGLYQPISTGVEFTLYEAASGTALKQINSQKAASDRISNGDQTVFSFPKIANSRGRRYAFTIKAPQSDRAHAVAVFLTGGEKYEKPYKTTATFMNGKKTGLDMNFVTYCSRSNSDILKVWLSGRSRFAHAGGAIAFFLVMLGLFAAASRLIGLLVTDAVDGDGD